MKLKSLRYCIIDKNLYWKDTSVILLNCFLEEEAEKVIEEFHKGDCGGHHYWKTTTNNILRAGIIGLLCLNMSTKRLLPTMNARFFMVRRSLFLYP